MPQSETVPTSYYSFPIVILRSQFSIMPPLDSPPFPIICVSQQFSHTNKLFLALFVKEFEVTWMVLRDAHKMMWQDWYWKQDQLPPLQENRMPSKVIGDMESQKGNYNTITALSFAIWQYVPVEWHASSSTMIQ